jgi:hypothetical protein
MRLLMHVKLPPEAFNEALHNGGVEKKMKDILEETKPETVYFTEYGGRRGAIVVVNLKDSSEIPKYAEPWFLAFNADVEFHPAMTPEDLQRAGIDKIAKKW